MWRDRISWIIAFVLQVAVAARFILLRSGSEIWTDLKEFWPLNYALVEAPIALALLHSRPEIYLKWRTLLVGSPVIFNYLFNAPEVARKEYGFLRHFALHHLVTICGSLMLTDHVWAMAARQAGSPVA